MSGPAMPSRGTPCHHCPDRYTTCSDHCQKPEFLAWKAEHQAILDAQRKDKAVWGYTAEQVRRNRRKM